MDLNFGNDSYSIALDQAKAATETLGSRLESFERESRVPLLS